MFHGQYIWLTFAYKDDESIVFVTWTLVRLHGLFVRADFLFGADLIICAGLCTDVHSPALILCLHLPYIDECISVLCKS